MNKNNKIIIAAIAVVALLLVICAAVFASGILSGNDNDNNTTYEVSFIDGDDVIKTLKVKEGNSVGRINDPVKEGYIFTGWYSDKELTTEFDFKNTRITENTNIYAKWVKKDIPEPGDITFTVTFNTDGASSIASQIIKEGEKAVKPADPIKSGYKFEGWYSDSSFTTKFDFKTPIAYDITLYAKFTLSQGGGGGGSITPPPITPDKTFTVTFDRNGGSAVPAQIIKEGEKAVKPNNPEKTGYTFAGWYSDLSFNNKFDFENTPINSDLTLYAKWVIGDYETNNNAVVVTLTQEQVKEIIKESKDETISLIDASEIENAKSASISLDTLKSVAANNKDVSITLPNASLTLPSSIINSIDSEAKTLSFTATPVTDKSSISSTDFIVEDRPVYEFKLEVGSKLKSNFDNPISISIPYTLDVGENPDDIVIYYVKDDGELSQESGEYKDGYVNLTVDHLSRFIILNNAEFMVTFDSQGGSPIQPILLKYNSKIEMSQNPTKLGCTFGGWYKDSDCTEKWIFETPGKIDRVRSNVTLYAKWTPDNYDISYELDGGTNSSGNPPSYTINSETITLNDPTKPGYKFEGWFSDSSFKTKVTEIAKGSTGNVSLYAKFSEIFYTVTLPQTNNAYSISPSESNPIVLKEGSIFKFSIKLAEEYANSDMIVKANNTEIKESNNEYTVEVTENIVISIEGIKKDSYSITVQTGEGFTLTPSSSTVNHESNVSFTFELNAAYSQSDYKIKVNGSEFSLVNNQFTVENVTSDLNVIVEGIKKNEYTVTFEYENDLKSSTVTITHGDHVTKPNNPTKEGYTFDQWTLNGNSYDFSTAVTSSITLTANWTASDSTDFNIYYWHEKDTSSNSEDKFNYSFAKAIASKGTTGEAAEFTPLTFDGFSYNSGLSDKNITISPDGSTIINLYYSRNSYNITYNSDGPAGPQQQKYGTKIILKDPEQKSGYKFAGWYLDSDFKNLFKSSTMPAENITLYAKWAANKYSITFNSNGGSEVTSITADYNTTITKPADPTKTGYTFAGWYSDSEFNTEWNFESNKMPVDGTTLYAKWSINSYTLTINYVYEDGSKAHEAYVVSVKYNSTYEVTSPSVDSCLPSIPIVSGTMSAEDLTIVVTYGEYLINIGENNYRTIEDALASAKEGDRLILLRDYTLQKDITIPKGILFVLPCSADDTGYDLTAEYEKEHNPDGTTTDSGKYDYLYRTLTISPDATLTVEGELLVNAVTGRAEGGYRVMDITGGYAQIILEGNIIVKNEGILEVCGYIKGEGQVTAESGAEVREMYIVQHWRGGSQGVSMYNNNVFPFNEYDCHSIQSKLIINSGASLIGNVKMFESEFTGYHYTRFPQIDNTNGLIRLADGAYLVKTFDPDASNGSSSSDKGKVTIEIHGGATASESSLHIVIKDLSSGGYLFPVDGDISFELYDGDYLIEKHFKFLTGSELTLHDGANLTISKDGALVFYDQFDDLCNISSTKYPDRPSAILEMMDGTSLTVHGKFGGIVRLSGEYGNANVDLNNAIKITYTALEANSTGQDSKTISHTFETKIQNRISFDYGNSNVDLVHVEKGQKATIPQTPEKTGYVFAGWFTDPGYEQEYDFNSIVTSNFTLYAKYDRAELTITFDSKEGSSVESKNVLYEELIEKPEDPVKTGYDFKGWFIDSNCTQLYDFTAPVTASFALYAGWNLKSYSINYELNEGTNHSNNPSQYDVENPKTFLSPSKTGYKFEGWYTDANFTNGITETSGKAENLTLYAKWAINTYEVTLNYMSDDISIEKITIEYNSALTESNLSKDRLGYTLTGWYRDSNYNTKWNFSEDKVINNVTIYAKWEAITWTITYELDEGTNNAGNPASYTIDTETITLKDPARLGYKFLGWFEASDFSGNKVTEIAKGSTGNITLYAKWEAVEYTVSFVNWDNSEISSKQYHYGDAVTAPATPTKPSDEKYKYEFSKWDAELAVVTESVTYTAVYAQTPIEYTITYVLDSGTNNQSNPETYNCESKITFSDPTKTGYEFKGWFSDSSFKTKVTEIAEGSTGNVTLYAEWKILTFTITIHTSDDYTISYESSTTVNYGADFEFTIAVNKMYDESNVIVKSNGTILTKSNEKYVIDNITENKTISVDGIKKNSYSIKVQTGEGFTLTPPSSTVEYGSDVSFTFILDTAYSQSIYKIKVNGSEVKLSNNQFTVENVTSDLNVIVEGIKKNEYTVTFEYENDLKSSTVTITHGDHVTKPVDPTKEGYTFDQWTLNESNYDFSTAVTSSITLTANWTPITYNVQFNGNGSTSGSMSNQTFMYDAESTLTTNAFAKTGYTFQGWSKTSTGNVEYNNQTSVTNLTTVNDETITLYAVWTPKQYTISYYANTGSGSISSQNVTYDSEVTLSNGSGFSKLGYKISKWNTNEYGSGTDYTLNSTYTCTNDSNLNLYAVWELIPYSISYELNGGTNSSGNQSSYTINSETITLNDPTKTGYEFKGWFKNLDFSGDAVTKIAKGSTGNVELYAKWSLEQYVISFDTNEGTPQPTEIPYSADTVSISLPDNNNLSRTGYTFAGWFTNTDCTTPFSYEKGTTTGNITLHAKWTAISYTITYYLNGGSASGNPDSYTIELAVTLNNPVKTGYTFAGWTGTDISVTAPSVQISIGSTGNRTYTANWNPITYNVHFDGNGSTSGSMSDQTFMYDAESTLTTNAFAKTGYNFQGWSKTSTGNVEYADNQTSVTNLTTENGKTITLYAVWSINHYEITLLSNEIGHKYEASVVSGYDASSVEYEKDFKFTVKFESSIGDNIPVVAFGEKTVSGTATSDNLTFEFTISNVTSDLTLLLSLVSDLSNALQQLVNENTSNDYKLELDGTTLTVSIINPNADASELIIKIFDKTSQKIPTNTNSGRTGTNFLAYLPDDDTLWKNNLAEYTVDLGGCKVIFKQDADAIEEAKIQYLTEIAQAVRVFRDNENWLYHQMYNSDILSTSAGIENDKFKFIELATLMVYNQYEPADFEIYVALLSNFATVLALVGHEDAEFGYYSINPNNLEQYSRVPIGGLNSSSDIQANAKRLLDAAESLLKQMNMGVSSISDPISKCFDENYNGLNGYAEQLCISKSDGIRYTDTYHFKFTNYFHSQTTKPTLHNITFDGTSDSISLRNFETTNNMVTTTFDFLKSYFGDEFGEPSCVYGKEYNQLVAGELIVIDIDASSGYTMKNIQVTSTSGEIKWYNDHSFIMPDGDVTISLK